SPHTLSGNLREQPRLRLLGRHSQPERQSTCGHLYGHGYLDRGVLLMSRLSILVVLALGSAGPLAAQGVLIAPHAVYLDHPRRSVADTAAVRVQLNLVVNTNIGLAYRKGPVATGVALSQLRARRVGDSVEVWSRLERRETAAYVGTVRAALVDSTGKVRSTLNAPIAVYFVMAPRY